MLAHICHPNTGEAEAGELLQGQPGIHCEFQIPGLQSETMPRKPKAKTKETFVIPTPNSQTLFKQKEKKRKNSHLSLTMK